MIDIVVGLAPSQHTMVCNSSNAFPFNQGLEFDKCILEGKGFLLGGRIVLLS